MATTDEDGTDMTMIATMPAGGVTLAEIGHFLVYTDGAVLKRVRIGEQGATIGRTAPAELPIGVPDISRRHCTIEIHGDWAVLTDLGSTNGTFLGDKRLDRPTRLLNGAQIFLGSFPIRYERRDLREVAEADALSAELRLAEEYVRAILPQPVTTGEVLAEWWFVPSSQLGGDAFGYQFLDDDNFIGFVLDVSGHGIGSAMHAANVANTLRRRALPDVDFRDPGQVCSAVNDVFPMEEHNGLMLTLWYFCYHRPSRMLRYCAAGHHPSFLITPGEPEPAPLWLRSPAIGMLPQAKWAVGETEMVAGAKVYVFSDGAFEIIDLKGEQWGLEHLREVVKQPAKPSLPEPQRIYHAVREASRPGPLDDDFSMLILTFK